MSSAHVLLDHAHIVHTQHACTCNGRKYSTYIYTYQKNSAVQLTSVELTHAYLNHLMTMLVSWWFVHTHAVFWSVNVSIFLGDVF